MIKRYKTVREYGHEQIVIKKSRFIGHAKPVQSEEEAVEFIELIKKEHWSATHNCFAYIVGQRSEYQKQSDDGEPSGTAGRPILEVLKQQELVNVVVVVTRYFGGVMLGAGGLIRAYTEGAVVGIDAAIPTYRVLHQAVHIELDYTWLGTVEHELRTRQVLVGESDYSDKVVLNCWPTHEDSESFVNWMTDLTQGQSVITLGNRKYIEHAVLPVAF